MLCIHKGYCLYCMCTKYNCIVPCTVGTNYTVYTQSTVTLYVHQGTVYICKALFKVHFSVMYKVKCALYIYKVHFTL